MSTLEITTMLGCPIMCNFCPQDELKDGYDMNNKYLSLDDFISITNKVPKDVRIDFSGMAEPWVNDKCTDMVEHALSQGFRVAIYTTLYNMTENDAIRVINLLDNYRSQVEVLCIHLQDKNNNMRGLKLDLNWLNIANLFIEFYNKKTLRNFQFMTMDESGELHPLLEPLKSVVSLFHMHDRAGSLNTDQIAGQQVNIINTKKGAIKCSYTNKYDQNVLLPNGDILMCCMDYGKKHNFGNILKGNYKDIFESNGYKELIIANFNEDLGDSICRKCERAINSN